MQDTLTKTFDDLPIQDRTILTRAAARSNAHVSEIYKRPRPPSEWERRAQMAAEWLCCASELVDIGCGSMTLRRLLPPSLRYQGIDLVARDTETIVIDLNAQRLPILPQRIASALGVMEYLYDPRSFLKSLRQFDVVVFSYCMRTVKLRRSARLERFWVNHFDREELEREIAGAGFEIKTSRRVSFSERLYLLS